MKDKTVSLICLVSGIVILEGIALYKGIDGQVLSLCIGTLGTIAGYVFGKRSPSEDEA